MGQAWSQDKAYVVMDDPVTGHPIAPLLPIGSFTCKHQGCGGVVEIDSREKAFCTNCGAIYNEGAAHLWFLKRGQSHKAQEVKLAKMVRACKG
jgi:hypothetical protein